MIDIAIPLPVFEEFVFQIPSFELFGVDIGPLGVRWYAMAYVVGLLAAWWGMSRLADRPALWGPGPVAPISRDDVDDLMFYAILGVLLGGRIGFALFYDPSLLRPDRLIRIWEGGMSFHGGLIGVSLAVIGAAVGRKISLWSLADAAASVAPVGMLLGRLANFWNQELWGKPADVPWAMIFQTDPMSVPRHPSQLYQAGLEGLVLLIVMSVAVWKLGALKRPGLTAGLFLTGMGLARIIGEIFREPDAPLIAGLSRGTIYSLPMVAVGLVFVVIALRRGGQGASARRA
jgi:phosphatidylglycerol:prolipoprotein diacylglycerol transferase